VKIRVLPLLIPCVLALGCLPVGPPRREQVSSSEQQHISIPVSRQNRPDAPQLKRLRSGHYRVSKAWTVNLNGHRWQIPAGYSTNGITAPASMKKSLGDGVNRPETWAAIFHDWLFTQPGISRATADRHFYDLLLAYGVSPSKARMMHATVAAYSLSKAFR
jgi:hypothetical protein